MYAPPSKPHTSWQCAQHAQAMAINAFAIVGYFIISIHLMLLEKHKMTFLRVCYPCMYLYGVGMHAFMYVSMVTHVWHSENILGVGLWLLP